MATDSQMMSTGYKQGDLMNLPEGTHLLTLKIRVEVGMSSQVNFSYVGEINVTRTKTFNFKFTVDEIQYEFIDGDLYDGCDCGRSSCGLPFDFIMFEMYKMDGKPKCCCGITLHNLRVQV